MRFEKKKERSGDMGGARSEGHVSEAVHDEITTARGGGGASWL